MRLSIIAVSFLALAALAQDNSLPATPSWQQALRGDASALAAAEELESLLSEGDLAALARHFPAERLRLMLLEAGVVDGLYGHDQARALIAAWLYPQARRVLRVSVVDLSEDGSHLSMLFLWTPTSPEDPLPPRQLACEITLKTGSWILQEALAP
ncbi:hypothetical protein H8E52_10990 [bacterium]|nr:hypothetical protein [bacterium]